MKTEKNYLYFLLSFWGGFLLYYYLYQWASERASTTFKVDFLILSQAILPVIVGISFYFLLKASDKGITKGQLLYFGLVFLLCLIFSLSYFFGVSFQIASIIYVLNPFFTLQSLMHLLLVYHGYKKSNLS